MRGHPGGRGEQRRVASSCPPVEARREAPRGPPVESRPSGASPVALGVSSRSTPRKASAALRRPAAARARAVR